MAPVLKGGTNDIVRGFGPDAVFNAYLDIVHDIKNLGAVPVICTVPPFSTGATNYAYRNAFIVQLNAKLRQYAKDEGLPLLDRYTALVNPDTGAMFDGYRRVNGSNTLDPYHMNAEGYRAITPGAHAALGSALAVKP